MKPPIHLAWKNVVKPKSGLKLLPVKEPKSKKGHPVSNISLNQNPRKITPYQKIQERSPRIKYQYQISCHPVSNICHIKLDVDKSGCSHRFQIFQRKKDDNIDYKYFIEKRKH